MVLLRHATFLVAFMACSLTSDSKSSYTNISIPRYSNFISDCMIFISISSLYVSGAVDVDMALVFVADMFI